jgi:hypothetical protein
MVAGALGGVLGIWFLLICRGISGLLQQIGFLSDIPMNLFKNKLGILSRE